MMTDPRKYRLRTAMHCLPRLSVAAVFALWCAIIAGCDDAAPPDAAPPTAQNPASDQTPHWLTHGRSVVLPASAPQDNPDLAAAIDKARSTMETARQRWQQATETDADHWAVKWAAPLEDGNVEYVWVRPESWSSFRIEGVLLDEPVHELLAGASRGEMVSFPADEACDWAHILVANGQEVIEGAYTDAALTRPRTTSK